jgi:hypothetical protein
MSHKLEFHLSLNGTYKPCHKFPQERAGYPLVLQISEPMLCASLYFCIHCTSEGLEMSPTEIPGAYPFS